MKTIFVMCALMFFSSCHSSKEVDELNRFVSSFNKDIAKNFNVQVYAIGSSIQDKISSIYLQYKSNKIVNVSQARSLIVALAEETLHKINNDQKIRPCLAVYPFTNKNIDVSFVFSGDKSKSCCCENEDRVANVSLIKGNVFYARYDTSINDLVTIISEPYEVAFEKAMNQSL